MEVEMIVEQQPVSFYSLLLKFDANQQFSKEIQLCAYDSLQNDKSNPYSDLPVKKTIYLSRLPPWTDPESIKNLMLRVSGEANIKVNIS